MTRLNKLTFKWLGLYRVMRANLKIRLYVLAELDNTEFNGTITENRLKFFYFRAEGFFMTFSEKNSKYYDTVKAQDSNNI
jgi:hypothetical protein